ncbi:hypothetical protein ACLOJK_000204 [Asimina triloba]
MPRIRLYCIQCRRPWRPPLSLSAFLIHLLQNSYLPPPSVAKRHRLLSPSFAAAITRRLPRTGTVSLPHCDVCLTSKVVRLPLISLFVVFRYSFLVELGSGHGCRSPLHPMAPFVTIYNKALVPNLLTGSDRPIIAMPAVGWTAVHRGRWTTIPSASVDHFHVVKSVE